MIHGVNKNSKVQLKIKLDECRSEVAAAVQLCRWEPNSCYNLQCKKRASFLEVDESPHCNSWTVQECSALSGSGTHLGPVLIESRAKDRITEHHVTIKFENRNSIPNHVMCCKCD